MTVINISEITISADPSSTNSISVTNETMITVSFDNSAMTAGQSFYWNAQFQYGDSIWHDGGGYTQNSGQRHAKDGSFSNIWEFTVSIPPQATLARATASQLVNAPIILKTVKVVTS